MSVVKEGLNGGFTINGQTIALLSEVTYDISRENKAWVPLGSVQPTQILLGAITYRCTAKRGHADNTYLGYLTGGSVLSGSIFPRGGTTPYIAGSVVVTHIGGSGMRQGTADPVMEDIEFTMYAVTHA